MPARGSIDRATALDCQRIGQPHRAEAGSEIVVAKVGRRLPVVLTVSEARALLNELNGTPWLIASLLYGTGIRLLEGLPLRAQLARAKTLHDDDLAAGFGAVWLPDALAVKYGGAPNELLGHKDVATTQIYTHVLN